MGGLSIGNYVFALVVVALVLFGLYAAVRTLNRGRLLGARSRMVTVLESTFVSAGTTLHVVKIGRSYLLVGGGSGHLTTLAQLPPEEIDRFLNEQKPLFAQAPAALDGFLKYVRRPPQRG